MSEDSFHRFDLISGQLNISFESVLATLWVTDDSDENPVVITARELYAQLSDICQIRGGYAIFHPKDIDFKAGKVTIGDTVLDCGRQICGYLRHSEQLILFICTAGEKFTQLRQDFDRNNDYLSGFVVDTLGSMVVEGAMDYIQQQIENSYAAQGCKITNRYSPGYCNWPLVDQRKLFGLLPLNDCGIQLTNSSLMLPIKSVSGLIGVGQQIKKSKYACDICNNKECIYRKVRNKNNVNL